MAETAAALGPASPGGGSHESGEHSPRSNVREPDKFLPIANISRIMKKALPANGKIAKDAKETVQECVSEFISFITSEASDKCQKEKRKTINGDDLLWAMATLGFEDYIDPLKIYLTRYREMEGDTKGSAKGGDVSAKKDVQPSPNVQLAHQGSYSQGVSYGNSQVISLSFSVCFMAYQCINTLMNLYIDPSFHRCLFMVVLSYLFLFPLVSHLELMVANNHNNLAFEDTSWKYFFIR